MIKRVQRDFILMLNGKQLSGNNCFCNWDRERSSSPLCYQGTPVAAILLVISEIFVCDIPNKYGFIYKETNKQRKLV